jgi:HEPN domain-containing protein
VRDKPRCRRAGRPGSALELTADASVGGDNSVAKRIFTSADGLAPAELVQSGLHHITAALALLDTHPRYYDSAGYLAHLGIELLLKGWLLEVSGRFGETHKLKRLHQELVQHHGVQPLDADHSALLHKLNTFETLRYPNQNSPTEIGNGDSDAIKALARSLYEAVPLTLLEALHKIESGKKAGRVPMRKRKVAAPDT